MKSFKKQFILWNQRKSVSSSQTTKARLPKSSANGEKYSKAHKNILRALYDQEERITAGQDQYLRNNFRRSKTKRSPLHQSKGIIGSRLPVSPSKHIKSVHAVITPTLKINTKTITSQPSETAYKKGQIHRSNFSTKDIKYLQRTNSAESISIPNLTPVATDAHSGQSIKKGMDIVRLSPTRAREVMMDQIQEEPQTNRETEPSEKETEVTPKLELNTCRNEMANLFPHLTINKVNQSREEEKASKPTTRPKSSGVYTTKHNKASSAMTVSHEKAIETDVSIAIPPSKKLPATIISSEFKDGLPYSKTNFVGFSKSRSRPLSASQSSRVIRIPASSKPLANFIIPDGPIFCNRSPFGAPIRGARVAETSTHGVMFHPIPTGSSGLVSPSSYNVHRDFGISATSAKRALHKP